MEDEMPQGGDSYLTQAVRLWVGGEALEAGKLVFENLPTKSRPKWASGILKLVLDKSGVQSPLFDLVLTTAADQSLWSSGHRLFSTLRDSTLSLNELRRQSGLSDDQSLFVSILSLAELVAKVIYNATDPPDEFDEDSGWWIVACLRAFVDNGWPDDEFAEQAWISVCSHAEL